MEERISLTTVMEADMNKQIRMNWFQFLFVEKELVRNSFDWLDLSIDKKSAMLVGSGILKGKKKEYKIDIMYSPFFNHRFDRISIVSPKIDYSHCNQIHVYPNDKTLCLYHPTVDRQTLRLIPLVTIIPWVTEWIINYEKWLEYGVWLGKEYKH